MEYPTHILIPGTGLPVDIANLSAAVQSGQIPDQKAVVVRVREERVILIPLPVRSPIGTPIEAKAVLSKWLASGENEIVPFLVSSAQAAVAEGCGADDERIEQLRRVVETRFRAPVAAKPEPEPKPEPAKPTPEIKFMPLF